LELEAPGNFVERTLPFVEDFRIREEIEIVSDSMMEMKTDQRRAPREEEVVATIEETPQDLILKISQCRHSAQQPLLSPPVEQETPEIPPSPKMAFELVPTPVDFPGCREQPDVRLAGLAENLSQQPDAIVLGTLETPAKIA